MIFFRPKWDMKSYFQLILYRNMERKWGVPVLSDELWSILKGHVFAGFYVICPIDARTDFELWRTRATLWSAEIDFKLMETVKKSLEIANQVKKRRFYVINDLRTRKMRARAFTRGNFLKCLKWPETYSNLIRKWFWVFLNFARA